MCPPQEHAEANDRSLFAEVLSTRLKKDVHSSLQAVTTITFLDKAPNSELNRTDW